MKRLDRPPVLVAVGLPGIEATPLTARCAVTWLEGGTSLEEATGRGTPFAGLLVLLLQPVTAGILEALPSLRVVANYAVGTDNIDVVAATARRVWVTNTPDVLTEATADLTFALILAAARRIPESDRFVREGRFTGWEPQLFLGRDLSAGVLGIVGPGRIGRAVARRGRGFGMAIVYTGRRAHPDWEAELRARRLPLEELLAAADVISLHLPLTPETRGMIGEKELALLRPTAILVNTSRGPVLDEGALARVLASGGLYAAGLDVYEDEPRVHPALLGLPNVVLTPHTGSAAGGTRERMVRMAVANLLAGLAGRRPPNPVNDF